MQISFVYLCTALLLACGAGIGIDNLSPTQQCLKNESPSNDKFILDESSWELMLEGEWMVGFCVPLVMNCIKFDRVWSKFAADIKQEKSPIIVASMKLEYSETVIRRFSIHELPTIIHVKNGVFRKLPVGGQKAQDLKELAIMKYQDTKPLPFWQHPNGFVIQALIVYIQAIDKVYHSTWLDIDYDHAKWLVRIGLVLILGMFITAICSIYSYIRDKRAANAKQELQLQLIKTEEQGNDGLAQQPGIKQDH